MDTPLHIVELVSENIKILKAVRIVPKGNTVIITGRNEQGKTSILDSIEYALGGAGTICEEPIRKGQQNARTFINLGPITVERTYYATSGETKLVVKWNGETQKSPQAILDKLCSLVAFDPLSFVRQKPLEQVETLSRLVGLDFKASDIQRRKLFDDRTLVGRELESAKATLMTCQLFEDVGIEPVAIGELMGTLTAAQNHNAAIAKANQSQIDRESKIESLDRDILNTGNDIAELHRQLATKEALLARQTDERKSAKEAFAQGWEQMKAMVPDDEASIRSEIEEVTNKNARIQANQKHFAQDAMVQKKRQEYDALTHSIEDIDQDKRDKLEWAEFPLEGLSFSDSAVLLNGIPFSQSSQARQLQAAVAIGLALNPRLRVILIRDASLLDDDSMKLIAELAQKHDAQIWMEVVNSKDPAAVVIEAGEVKKEI
jgi:hypothetical protein